MTEAGEQKQVQPRGSARRLRAGVIALFLLVSIVSVPFLILRLPAVRQLVLSDLAKRLGWGENVTLSISAIKYFNPAGFSFADIDVTAPDSTGVVQEIISVGQFSASWSLSNFLSWRIAINNIDISSVSVCKDHLYLLDGKSAEDEPDTKPARAATGKLPRVKIQQFNFGPSVFTDHTGEVCNLDINLSNISITPENVVLTISGGKLDLDRLGLEIETQTGLLSWNPAGTGAVRGLNLLSEDLRGRVSAVYNYESEIPYSVSLFIDRLNPSPITSRYLPGIVPAPDDSLAGLVFFEAGVDGHNLNFDLTGRLQSETLHQGRFGLEINNGEIVISDLTINADAGNVNGNIIYHPATRQGEASLAWTELDFQTNWLPWVNVIPLDAPFGGACDVDFFAPPDSQVTIMGQVEVLECRPWGVDIDRIGFKGEVRHLEAVFADTVVIDLPGGGVHGYGYWPLDDRPVDISADIDSLQLLSLPVAWRQAATGLVRGQAHISGIAADPVIEGSLQIQNLQRGEWHSDLLSAGSLLFWPRDIRGSGNLELWRLQNGDGPVSNVNLRFSRWDRWVSIDSNLRLPQTEAHLVGRIDPLGQLEIESGSFLIPDVGSWRLNQPWTLFWSADSLVADTLCFSSELSRLCLYGNWIGKTKQISADLSLTGFDFSDLGDLHDGLASFRGNCDLEVGVSGYLPDPMVLVDFSSADFEAGPFKLGQVSLDAIWENQSLSVGPVTLNSNQQNVVLPELKLQVDETLGSLIGLDRDSIATAQPMMTKLGQSSWAGQIQVNRFDFSQWDHILGLRSGTSEGSLRNIEMLRTIGGRQVPIRVEAPWDLQPTKTGTGGLSGVLAGGVSISGTPAHPVLNLAAQSEQLYLAGVPVGSLDLNLAYADSVLILDSLSLSHESTSSRVNGSYPYNIMFLPPETGPLPDTVAVSAILSELNLALLSGFLRDLPDAEGELNGRINIGGLGTAPVLEGHLQLENGGCRIPGRSERIYGARAEAALSTEGLRIPFSEAYSGPHGVISGEGLVNWNGLFDFRGQAENIQVLEQGQYDFLVTADSLHLWRDPLDDPATRLTRITGNIEVLQGSLTPDLSGGAGAGGGQPKELPYLIDLNISVPGNIRVSQTNAKVHMGEGDLKLAYRAPNWNISGGLNILSGNYRLFNNNFIIRDGTLDFRDSGTGPDVTVAINGETFVVATSQGGTGEEGNVETITIEVNVQGKPDNLQISLSSVPPLSPEEIVELLSYGRFINSEGNFAGATTTTNMLFNTLVERVEQNLAEQFPLFAHVAFEPGVSGDGTRVSVRPVITPAFTGNYSQELSLDPAWELSLYYRLSRMLYLRAGVARDRQGTANFDDEYSLDLKCRFEY